MGTTAQKKALVIAKLTDGKATHIPYRDSKLTRLLQSSLSGQGRVSLICTVTPSSSNAEETHNTLKFAHRAKCVEIQASQNKIIDEKSLIKKYQNEIRCLKQELEQLKRGIVTVTPQKDTGEDDIFLLKQKLAYLPYRRRDMILDNENGVFYAPLEGFGETNDDGLKEEKKNKKHGLLNWFKLRKRDSGLTTLTSSDGDKSSVTKSYTTPSTPQAESVNFPSEPGISNSIIPESIPADDLPDVVHDRELPADDLSFQETPLISIKTIDHVELLREQLKILTGEVALHSSVLKRLSDEAAKNPKNEQIQMEMSKASEGIKAKNQQIASLEKQMANSISVTQNRMSKLGLSPSYAELLEELNEKSLELEVKTADNNIIQDQLQQKICECEELQETIASLKQQLVQAHEMKDFSSVSEVQELKQKVSELSDTKSQLEARNQKLAEESAYAKGLASAAGVELKALSEEVTKLMNHNERLAAELASMRNSGQRRVSNGPKNTKRDSHVKRHEPIIKRELTVSRERELEAALKEKEKREAELHKKVEESKQRETFLENELANMWVLMAKLKNAQGNEPGDLESIFRCRYSLLPLSLPLSSLSLLAATVPTATITAPALALAITAATLPASPPPIAAATLPSPPRSRRRYRCHRCRHYSRLVAIAAVALSSPWPLHPSKVHTRTSDDQRRKDAGRESERDSGSIRRHDDYSRHRRHVDEKNRNYLMSSRAGRESRDYRHSDDTEKHKNKNKEREPDKDYDGDISTPRLKESEKGDVPSSSSRQDKQLHEKINSETLNSTTNNVEATGDVNSAKVAAMKAAEFGQSLVCTYTFCLV
ncbi:hypothetical protein MUK42_33523 [Musa troglodytarum]|uniref:Kinesin motor domain-containing protein n=1 Tax=Musa troglodytarum TaxID=320322 RepID=A0A9E7L0F0_9LILI|nr:hypothetical protein MUK42_33523 [Musa troglodytarum]URE33499.1 hypothetical protein MUK42_33523 [Musa troglodytarum]